MPTHFGGQSHPAGIGFLEKIHSPDLSKPWEIISKRRTGVFQGLVAIPKVGKRFRNLGNTFRLFGKPFPFFWKSFPKEGRGRKQAFDRSETLGNDFPTFGNHFQKMKNGFPRFAGGFPTLRNRSET
jgi:hypothetical protein